MIVNPETLIGWHRKGFKLFWRWKSRLGRPRNPKNIRQLVVRMVQENPRWHVLRVLPRPQGRKTRSNRGTAVRVSLTRPITTLCDLHWWQDS